MLKIRGGVLEDTFWSPWPWPRRSSPWPWPWPRSLKSSKIALSSARGQHYFLNSWNFLGKRQKPRRKFANTFFVFLTSSIGVAKGRMAGGPSPSQLKFQQWQKCYKKAYSSFSFSFFWAFFVYNSITNNNIEDQELRVPLNSIFTGQFKRITRRKQRVFVLKVAISGPNLAFLWT